MAGFDYGRMQKTATRLLQRFKQGVVTLTRVIPRDAEPETPWLPAEPLITTHDLDATVAAITVDQANAKFIDGTVITTADLVVTCAVPAVSPNMSDLVTIDGVAQTIKKIIALPAAGTPVAFKLIVGGGGAVIPAHSGYLPMLDFSKPANSMYIGQVV